MAVTIIGQTKSCIIDQRPVLDLRQHAPCFDIFVVEEQQLSSAQITAVTQRKLLRHGEGVLIVADYVCMSIQSVTVVNDGVDRAHSC